MRHTAVVDMGSNSFRLVVYGYEPERHWQQVDEIREAVRVSAGMDEEGRLQPEPMERAVHTAHLFASFCRTSGIDDVVAVATSAIRGAPNGGELLERIRAETGLDAHVIDEAREAWYGYLAIANSTTIADGFGVDIGGGSVQVMRIEDRRLVRSESWPIGAVRVSERFLPTDDTSNKQLKALRKHVGREVASAPWFEAGGSPRIAGIGGTIRNLAAAAAKRAGLEDSEPEGFCLTRPMLADLIDELSALPASKRSRVPGIKPDRADVILGGAAVLAALMERGGFEEIETSGAGLREGVFFERYLGDRDPPLFDDVRRASVTNLAHRYHEDVEHPKHVATLSLQIYDGLRAAGLARDGDADRDLLWAACMLHDIGTAVDYDDHHKHSRYLILNAGLPGFSRREVALVALIARYHRKGEPDAGELGPLARKGDDRRLSLLSGIIRLAEQLERSRDRAVGGVRLTAENGTVELAPETSAVDATVAIWSARRSSDLLARAIERRVEIAGPG